MMSWWWISFVLVIVRFPARPGSSYPWALVKRSVMASSAAVQQLQAGTSNSAGTMISRLRQYFEEKSKPSNPSSTASTIHQQHHQR